jgi:uncharacterized membrane protein YccC
MGAIEDVIQNGLGIGPPQLFMIATFFFGLIICAKNYKIGAMIWTIMYFTQFILFYELFPDTLYWVQALTAWFIAMVFMFLLLFLGFWKYEDRRKVIT